jgi:type VI protein secretion system component Hcp
MAKDSYDIFLVLTRADGSAVDGESTDAAMATDPKTGKAQGPIEIDDFTFSLEKASFQSEDKLKGAVQKLDDSKYVEESTKKAVKGALKPLMQEVESLQAIIEQNKADVGGKLVREHAFSIKKGIDLSSPELFRAFCEGTKAPSKGAGSSSSNGSSDSPVKKSSTFSKAVVSVRKAGGSSDNTYLRFEFEDLNIVHYSVDVDGIEHDEKVDFTFDKVTVTYRPQDSTGMLTEKAPEALIAEIDFRMDAEAEQD